MALQVTLVVPRRRVWCEQCGGPRLEKLSWLGRYQRVTNRLAEAVNQLLASSNILATARFFGLGWHTVKALDKAWLRQSVAAPDWSRIHYLAMDEFALHKGHRYATVVVDPISRQVLWVGNGRSRETARTFFEQLPAGVAGQIRAVAIDMTTAYELEIKAHCPNAEVVYDLFHVVAKYGREVIDRVRVDQANQLRQDKPARRVIKSSRWLLLRNRSNLDPRQTVQLDELLQANQPLLTAYLMRDELKRLWFYRHPSWARKAWIHWLEQAQGSGIAALEHFAHKLKAYLHGILSRCRHRLNTSIVEGINNTIKVIKRRASATAPIVIPTIIWLASLVNWPEPAGPTCTGRPSTDSTSRARSKSAASPPAMMASVPASAPSVPPDTGASSDCTPKSARRRA